MSYDYSYDHRTPDAVHTQQPRSFSSSCATQDGDPPPHPEGDYTGYFDSYFPPIEVEHYQRSSSMLAPSHQTSTLADALDPMWELAFAMRRMTLGAPSYAANIDDVGASFAPEAPPVSGEMSVFEVNPQTLQAVPSSFTWELQGASAVPSQGLAPMIIPSEYQTTTPSTLSSKSAFSPSTQQAAPSSFTSELQGALFAVSSKGQASSVISTQFSGTATGSKRWRATEDEEEIGAPKRARTWLPASLPSANDEQSTSAVSAVECESPTAAGSAEGSPEPTPTKKDKGKARATEADMLAWELEEKLAQAEEVTVADMLARELADKWAEEDRAEAEAEWEEDEWEEDESFISNDNTPTPSDEAPVAGPSGSGISERAAAKSLHDQDYPSSPEDVSDISPPEPFPSGVSGAAASKPQASSSYTGAVSDSAEDPPCPAPPPPTFDEASLADRYLLAIFDECSVFNQTIYETLRDWEQVINRLRAQPPRPLPAGRLDKEFGKKFNSGAGILEVQAAAPVVSS